MGQKGALALPLDLGISALLADEVDRFRTGLDALSDGGARMARATAARRRWDDPAPRQITIPAWDDVIHVVPQPQITPAMREAHYGALRAGRPSPLSADLQDNIAARGRRARLMNNAASPEYAKAWGQVMTAIDNVQDLLTTVVTVGRLGLIPAIRGIDALLPGAGQLAAREAGNLAAQAAARATGESFAAAIVELSQRVAAGEAAAVASLAETRAARSTAIAAAARLAFREGSLAAAAGFGARTIGRAIPILGWVLLGADLLKLLQTFGMLSFPFYAALCGGPRAALAAGVPAVVMGRALKLRAGGMARLNPFGRHARVSRSRTVREWKPSIYNLMEVFQTTDSLFGVGVSFGGLVGLMQDSAFGVEQKLRGQDVRVSTDRVTDSFHRLYSGRLAREGKAALHDLRTSANVLATAPIINGVQDIFTLEEHIEALCAQTAAWDILRPYIEAPETVEAVNLALEVDWDPPVYLQGETEAWTAAAGLPADGFGTWALPGSPTTISGEDYMNQAAPRVTAALRELLEPRRDSIEAPFIGALVDRIGSHAAVALTGSDDAIETEMLPVYQIMESLALAHRWPAVTGDETPMLAFFAACAARMAELRARSLGPADLDRLAEAADISLIHALGPEAPYPRDFFEPRLSP